MDRRLSGFNPDQQSSIVMATLALPPSSSTAAMRAPLSISIQIGCYLTILSYAIFFEEARGLGTPALAIAIGCTILVWLPMMRWYVQRSLLWYALLAAIYVVLSAAGWLHWDTLLFDRGAILQESIYAFIMPVLVPAFAYYHERVSARDHAFLRLDNLVLALCVASKLFHAISIRSVSELGVIQLFNVEAIFAFSLVRRIFYTQRPSTLVNVVIVAILAATAGSFQSVLVTLFLVGVLLAPALGRAGLVCFIVGLVAISFIAVPFADAIWQIDPNTGIRLFFWRDALDRLLASYGVGQGFGTETIRPLYQLSTTDVSIATLDQSEFILIGSHNAFIDAGYRMGVIGMALLVFYVSGLFRAAAHIASPKRAFDYFACALLFVIMMVNVGLVSINFLFGASFVMGWLVFRSSIGFADTKLLMGPAAPVSGEASSRVAGRQILAGGRP